MNEVVLCVVGENHMPQNHCTIWIISNSSFLIAFLVVSLGRYIAVNVVFLV